MSEEENKNDKGGGAQPPSLFDNLEMFAAPKDDAAVGRGAPNAPHDDATVVGRVAPNAPHDDAQDGGSIGGNA